MDGTPAHRRRDSDIDLALEARESPSAFGDLFERHAGGVFAFCLAQTRDREVSAELTSETFARALQLIRRFDPQRPDATVGGWLRGIANNELRYLRRKQRVRARSRRRVALSELMEPDHAGRSVDRLAAEANGRQLRMSLERLPASQRKAVELRVIDELPYEECAVRLGTSPETARQHVSRGLKALRNDMEGAGR
jgi:RNA polymerase sigma factor (sigma-70 family)